MTDLVLDLGFNQGFTVPNVDLDLANGVTFPVLDPSMAGYGTPSPGGPMAGMGALLPRHLCPVPLLLCRYILIMLLNLLPMGCSMSLGQATILILTRP
jgi:hypothetical protein